MRITHKNSLAVGSADRRPEVFFSGELHGNERVGPTTTLEAAHILLVAADCVERGIDEANPDFICQDLSSEEETMLSAGAPEKEQRWILVRRLHWLHRMVKSRSIVVMPTARGGLSSGVHVVFVMLNGEYR